MLGSSRFARSLKSPWQWAMVGLVILVLGSILAAPLFSRIKCGPVDARLQMARQINEVMFAYGSDHYGKYPSGKSSTEIFQKLMDDSYVSDPAIFYWPMPGKVKPVAGMKLRPENVCWDVVIPADDKDSEATPAVVITGYKVQYVPGGSAVPVDGKSGLMKGIFVSYGDGHTVYISDDGSTTGVIPNVIPKDADLGGKKFVQLTPDGMLP